MRSKDNSLRSFVSVSISVGNLNGSWRKGIRSTSDHRVVLDGNPSWEVFVVEPVVSSADSSDVVIRITNSTGEVVYDWLSNLIWDEIILARTVCQGHCEQDCYDDDSLLHVWIIKIIDSIETLSPAFIQHPIV